MNKTFKQGAELDKDSICIHGDTDYNIATCDGIAKTELLTEEELEELMRNIQSVEVINFEQGS